MRSSQPSRGRSPATTVALRCAVAAAALENPAIFLAGVEATGFSRLRDHVYPVIGMRLRDVTLSNLERVMASLKGKRRKKRSAGMRRHVALALNRLLSLVVYPLKILETNLVPRQGFLPRKADARR